MIARTRVTAFTLVETLVAVAIFTVGSGILYQSFIGNLVLASKNAALNIGNAALQKCCTRMLAELEASAAFVDCANYDPATNVLSPVANGTWGNSMRFMRMIGTLYVLPEDGSGYDMNNPPPSTRQVYLNGSAYFVNLTFDVSKGLPWTYEDRLFTTYPRTSGPGKYTTSPGTKPGLAQSGGWTSGNVLTLTFNSGPGNNAILDCNKAYLVREAAFMVLANPDGSKSLYYCPDTKFTTSRTLLCSFLDGGNQIKANDSSIPTGGTSGTFCMTATGDTVQALLPIRSPNSLNLMSRRGGASARNNTWVNVNVKFRQRQDL